MERQETTSVFGYEPMDSELPIIEVSKSVKTIISSEMHCLDSMAHFVTCQENASKPLTGVDAILLGTEEFNEKDLEERPNLKCISRIGTGTDNIRLPQRVIDNKVIVEDIWTPKAVADYDLRWLYRWLDFPGQENATIHDVTVGIIGASGRIGMEIGTELNGKVKNILRNDPFGLSDPLEEVLANSDILFVHIPSTPENRHYIDAEFLDQCGCSMIVAPVRSNVIDFEGIRGFKGGVVDRIVVDCELPRNREGLDLFWSTGHTATRTSSYYNRMIRQAALNAIGFIRQKQRADSLKPVDVPWGAPSNLFG